MKPLAGLSAERVIRAICSYFEAWGAFLLILRTQLLLVPPNMQAVALVMCTIARHGAVEAV